MAAPRALALAWVVMAACGPRTARVPPVHAVLVPRVERVTVRTPSRAHCPEAAVERARLPELATAGRLERVLRVAATARALCPPDGAATWAVELPALAEIGRDREARALASQVKAAPGAAPEAVAAADAVLARPARKLRAPDDAAAQAALWAALDEAAKAPDAAAAYQAAWDRWQPSGEALLGLAEAARRAGDGAAAQRFTDRALVDFELEGRPVTLERDRPLHSRDTAAWSPDGSLLALAEGHEVGVVDVGARREIMRLRGHDSWVSGIAFSPGGELIATSSADGTVRLWRTRDGVEAQRFVEHVQLGDVQFSGDGTKVSADTGEAVRTWPTGLRPHALLSRLPGPGPGAALDALAKGSRPTCTAWSVVGRRTLVGRDDGAIVILDAKGGVTATLATPGQHRCWQAAFSHDGRLVAVEEGWGETGTLWVQDLVHKRRLWSVPGHDISKLVFLPGDRALLAGGSEAVAVWELPSGRVLAKLDDHRLEESSPDGRLWRVTRGDASYLFDPLAGTLWPALPAELHQLAATATLDRAVMLDREGTALTQVVDHGHVSFAALPWLGRPEALALTPDGARLASLDPDGALHLWDVAGGREQARLGNLGRDPEASPWRHRSLALSPDAARVVVASGSHAQSYDGATGTEVARVVLKDQGYDTPRLLASPDGAALWAVAGFTPSRLAAYDPATGKAMGELPVDNFLGAIARLPSGDLILSESEEARAGASPIRVVAAITKQAPATHRRECATRRWQLATALDVRTFPGCGAVAVSGDGRRLAVEGRGAIDIWGIATGLEITRVPTPEGLEQLALSGDGHRLVALSSEGGLHAWSVDDARHLWGYYPDAQGGLVLDGEGRVDLLGDSPDAMVCRAGARRISVEACLERSREPDLASRQLAGETLDLFLPAPAR